MKSLSYSEFILKNKIFFLVFLLFISTSSRAFVPRPDHVVICVLENHGTPQVIGSSAAPYINQLASMGANMLEFYALTHPSQPNYIMAFSGSNQGVTTDALPTGTPWSTANLGAALIDAGFTFGGYSEDLPAIGSTVEVSGYYARKHNPWVNWQGTGTNQIPASCNMPMTLFPTDYNLLPDLCYVIPNVENDMHNGTDPTRITVADDWIRNHLSAYINWAMNHNSLFILTFDEDNNFYQNRIPTIFVGPMVQAGDYLLNGYNHYDMLRTLEDMFALPYAGQSASAQAIEEIWSTSGLPTTSGQVVSLGIYPNPITQSSRIYLSGTRPGQNLKLTVFDLLGNEVRTLPLQGLSLSASFPFPSAGLQSGVYFYRLTESGQSLCSGKIVLD